MDSMSGCGNQIRTRTTVSTRFDSDMSGYTSRGSFDATRRPAADTAAGTKNHGSAHTPTMASVIIQAAR
jgi:hypothetical protein